MDKTSLKLLKIFAKRSHLSCNKLSTLCDVSSPSIAPFMAELFANGFIRADYDMKIKPGDPIGLNTDFSISPKGLSAIEDVRRSNIRFRIPVIISIIALILSIFSIILQTT